MVLMLFSLGVSAKSRGLNLQYTTAPIDIVLCLNYIMGRQTGGPALQASNIDLLQIRRYLFIQFGILDSA